MQDDMQKPPWQSLLNESSVPLVLKARELTQNEFQVS